jgi:cytochrome c oxidase subunit IV
MSSHAHHIDPRKEARTYAGILTILVILTFVTVGASYIKFESGMINVVIAITIATIKASLVALFFMHLLHEKPINALIFLISAFMLGLLLILCYIDYESRDHITPPNYKGEVPLVSVPPTAPAPAGAPEH